MNIWKSVCSLKLLFSYLLSIIISCNIMNIGLPILLLCFSQVFSLEPITTGSFIVGAVLSYYYGSSVMKTSLKVVDLAFCKVDIFSLHECCGKPWIKNDVTGLRNDLKKNLFGQHIVQQIVPPAIAASISATSPTKPLVMSFHGWPGSGKNYVSLFIAKNYFEKGDRSKFFHLFVGRVHFPSKDKVYIYQEQLRSWIRGNVTECAYSMFVFDEVDKMPAGILDGIKPFLDHHQSINGVDFRRAIFIFLSNIGGDLITERYLELWRKYGKTREQMTLHDFDHIINQGAFNQAGGLQKSDVIDHSLIDHYVPFLPLEKSHVMQCITAELNRHNVAHNEKIINEVLKIVTYGPKPESLFSTTGCKRLSQKVAALVEQKKYYKSSFEI